MWSHDASRTLSPNHWCGELVHDDRASRRRSRGRRLDRPGLGLEREREVGVVDDRAGRVERVAARTARPGRRARPAGGRARWSHRRRPPPTVGVDARRRRRCRPPRRSGASSWPMATVARYEAIGCALRTIHVRDPPAGARWPRAGRWPPPRGPPAPSPRTGTTRGIARVVVRPGTTSSAACGSPIDEAPSSVRRSPSCRTGCSIVSGTPT